MEEIPSSASAKPGPRSEHLNQQLVLDGMAWPASLFILSEDPVCTYQNASSQAYFGNLRGTFRATPQLMEVLTALLGFEPNAKELAEQIMSDVADGKQFVKVLKVPVAASVRSKLNNKDRPRTSLEVLTTHLLETGKSSR